eukprot:8556798-Pyramimonas_sp.AAC.1
MRLLRGAILLSVAVLSAGSATIESLCARSGHEEHQSPDSDRKKVVVLVGLEGSGHHLVESVLEDRLDLENKHCPSEVVEGRIDFDEKFLEFVQDKPYTIFGQVSFPEGSASRIDGILVESAHPSLLNM